MDVIPLTAQAPPPDPLAADADVDDVGVDPCDAAQETLIKATNINTRANSIFISCYAAIQSST